MEQGFQMGFSWEEMEERYIPNGTECSTWSDIEQSHMIEEHEAVIKLDNIYVTMGLLGLGLFGAVLTMMMEHLTKDQKLEKKKTVRFASGNGLDRSDWSSPADRLEGPPRP